ncbi:cytochrome c [Gemmatimonas sp.]|uniref:c-type cytochrome n=1 Tax=Gemmatimonas sp. TaxID=1962908 RepID=UPI0027B920A4|nr:cytochrome c [Gemmatimonas sp.]
MRRFAALSLLLLAAACRSSGAGAGTGAAAKPAAPAEVTAARVALGDSLFNNGGCMRCHGAKGIGAQNGPALNDNQWDQLTSGSYAEIRALIVSGVPKDKIKVTTRPNAMGARGGRMNLDDEQITAVAAYVWTLSHK